MAAADFMKASPGQVHPNFGNRRNTRGPVPGEGDPGVFTGPPDHSNQGGNPNNTAANTKTGVPGFMSE